MINVSPKRRGYITRWPAFRFLPGTLSALKRLRAAGRRIIVVSNQAGVGRGLFSPTDLKEITRNMLGKVRDAGGRIDAVYYCTHTPERRCLCRKPRTGLLRKAARRFSLDLRESIVVGDNATDIEMGQSAGCRTVLVLTGVTTRSAAKKLSRPPDFIARDLAAAARWILR